MKTKIAELLAEKIEGFDVEKVEQLLEVPPKADMGDFAFPCFQLAKDEHYNIISVLDCR